MLNRALRARICRGALVAAMALAMPIAMAWTNKPIRVVVPGPAGGAMDAVARSLADQLSKDIGQPVVVDNRPGAGGILAVKALLASPPDGQTIMVATTNILTEYPLMLKVPYDTMKDLKPVAAMAKMTLVLVGSPSLPPTDLPGLIRYVKANPGKLSYATPAKGSAHYYAGVIMNKEAGMDLQNVPFTGSPAGLTQVMGGQVTVMYDGMVTSLPFIRSGKLRAFAIAAKERSQLLPQVPTFAEMGYPNVEFSNWAGVFVSARVSPELTEKIRLATYKVASDDQLRKRFMMQGMEPVPPQTLPQLSQALKVEFDRNANIVKTFNIQP